MGPLTGTKLIELAGIGPGPFCGMMLADMGAEVIRVNRTNETSRFADVLARGRKSIAVDLKESRGKALILELCKSADAIFEGFRPGVTERLGLGPDDCMAVNPSLVYGRMTGWGQDGPMAHAAGHDINYISLAGALHAIGPKGGKPVPPLNLVGDFGGGGLLLAFGLVCAILEAQKSGKGQVVDAAMVDGAAILHGDVFYPTGYRFSFGNSGVAIYSTPVHIFTIPMKPAMESSYRLDQLNRSFMLFFWRMQVWTSMNFLLRWISPIGRIIKTRSRKSLSPEPGMNCVILWKGPMSVLLRCCLCPRCMSTHITRAETPLLNWQG